MTSLIFHFSKCWWRIPGKCLFCCLAQPFQTNQWNFYCSKKASVTDANNFESLKKNLILPTPEHYLLFKLIIFAVCFNNWNAAFKPISIQLLLYMVSYLRYSYNWHDWCLFSFFFFLRKSLNCYFLPPCNGCSSNESKATEGQKLRHRLSAN